MRSDTKALASAPTFPRRAIAFIFVSAVLDMLSFGIVIPVFPLLIRSLTGHAGAAAQWIGLSGAGFAALQFICLPVLGSLSDRFGRRPVLLLSSLGLSIYFLVLASTDLLPVLLLARMLSGVTTASFTTINAYVADSAPPERRAAAMGIVGGAFGIGFIMGPALGSMLAMHGLRLPFWVAAGFSVMNFIYGLFVLPESLPPGSRTHSSLRKALDPFSALALLAHKSALLRLGAVYLSIDLAHYALLTLFVVFITGYAGWSMSDVGYAVMLLGASDGLSQIALTGPLVSWIGGRRTVYAGLAIGCIAFCALGFARTPLLVYIAVPLLGLSSIANGPVQSLMTEQVDEHAQGRLQGAVSGLGSIAGIVSPLLFAQVFSWSVVPHGSLWLPGLPFLLAGAFLTVGGITFASEGSKGVSRRAASLPAELEDAIGS